MMIWVSFGMIITLFVIVIFLVRKILSLKSEINIILEQLSVLKINDKLQKKRIENQIESIVKSLLINSQLKSKISSLQKEVKSLQQLLNN